MLYKNGVGTEETRRKVLKLWALAEVYPNPLSEGQISEAVKKLIPEKFGAAQFYLWRGIPYFEDFAEESIRLGFIKKTTPSTYQLTPVGIARIQEIEERFLREVA